MVGVVFIIIALIISATIIAYKYIDKVRIDDVSYGHYYKLMNKLEHIEQLINQKKKEE